MKNRSLPKFASQALNSELVRACHSSSDRSRIIIIAIILTSIFSFFCLWNSYQFSWINERMALEAETLKWLDVFLVPDGAMPKDTAGPRDMEGLLGTLNAEQYKLVYDSERLKGLPVKPERLRDVFEHLVSAFGFDINSALESKITVSRFQARSMLRIIEEKEAEYRNQLIDKSMFPRIPVLGVAFDVNDLGILSGISFVVLLAWLRFSLVREKQNIAMTFDSARVIDREDADARELHRVYYTLSTRQVLTSPRFGHFPNEKFWDIVPQVLIALPALVHLLVLINDLKTIRFGTEVSPALTVWSLISSCALFVAEVVLVIHCIVQWWQNNRLWSEAFTELNPNGE